MESPPLAKDIPQNSKKRVCGGSSASSFMDPDVIEISAPNFPAKRKPKQNQVIVHEVIDVDKYEDSADVMILGEKVDMKNKGKAIKNISNGFGNCRLKDALVNHPHGAAVLENLGSLNGVESSYDDDCIDFFPKDFMEVDEYGILQASFDKVDIPAGVEASFPWLLDFDQSEKKMEADKEQFHTNYQSNVVGLNNLMPTSGSSSNQQASVDGSGHPVGYNFFSPWLPPKAAESKTAQASELGNGKLNSSCVKKSSKLFRFPQSSHEPRCRSKTAPSGSSTEHSSVLGTDAMTPSFGVEPSLWQNNDTVKKQVGHSNLFQLGPFLYPPCLESPKSLWQELLISEQKAEIFNSMTHSSSYDPFDAMLIPPEEGEAIPQVQDSAGNLENAQEGDILRRVNLFKQFDTVEGHLDHHYASNGSKIKQPPKSWAKKIQEEWQILEKDLPDTIFVRVYESRMDLLRAVIVGAEGTPYHDGLFFFDVFFPTAYPNVPPHVYYHSGGLRLNPNLYSNGKVCLSLLNTWSGDKNEMWIPGVSTMLQVLVSIQALILNKNPFFNEPGYEYMRGSENGELRSQKYNEDTFLLSLRTMLYTMRRPPKHFKDFVVGHFYKRAHDILVACKAYMDGAQVGCLVKGGVQDLDAGDKSCSNKFKASVAGCVDMLVKEFRRMGVKDCEKFLTEAKKGPNEVNNVPPLAK